MNDFKFSVDHQYRDKSNPSNIDDEFTCFDMLDNFKHSHINNFSFDKLYNMYIENKSPSITWEKFAKRIYI